MEGGNKKYGVLFTGLNFCMQRRQPIKYFCYLLIIILGHPVVTHDDSIVVGHKTNNGPMSEYQESSFPKDSLKIDNGSFAANF